MGSQSELHESVGAFEVFDPLDLCVGIPGWWVVVDDSDAKGLLNLRERRVGAVTETDSAGRVIGAREAVCSLGEEVIGLFELQLL